MLLSSDSASHLTVPRITLSRLFAPIFWHHGEVVNVAMYTERSDINIIREVYDEAHFADPDSSREEFAGFKHHVQGLCGQVTCCSCSWNRFRSFLFQFVPIFDWLPKYNLKENILRDITGGVTVGIMHIPQGNLNSGKAGNFERVGTNIQVARGCVRGMHKFNVAEVLFLAVSFFVTVGVVFKCLRVKTKRVQDIRSCFLGLESDLW